MASGSRRTKTSGSSDADRYSAAIREIQSSAGPENKKCFECQQRGPTYVDMTVGSFVCTKCSGILRGITPPHRIKSISMSSFSADEVEVIRGRGNVYCAKVWLGLHDGKSIGSDAESIKEFIIQKYEKKRYYVDPSTIRHSLGSTASTASSISQQSDGCNLIPVTSSTSVGSVNGTSKGSEMIGTTIQMQLHSKKQSNLSQLQNSSSNRNAPAFSSASTSLGGVQLPMPGSQPLNTVFKPKPLTVTVPATVTTVAAGNSLNQSALSAFVLPPPNKDSFAPVKANQPSRSRNSAFPEVSFPPPTMPKASQKSTVINQQPNTAPQSSSSAVKPPNAFEANFANFDNADFENKKNGDLSKPSSTSLGQTEHGTAMESKTPEDRYAALKDLDDIFKCTVMCEGPTNKTGNSTGASIFGTTTVPSKPLMSSTIETAADRTNMTPPPLNNTHGIKSNDTFSSTTQAKNTGWPVPWPQEQQNNALNTISVNNQGSSTNSYPPSVTSSNNKHFDGAFTSKPNNSPINPFIGASNLTQLNTSPWPTTGSSPVQSATNVAWPPSVTNNLKAEGDNAFSKQPGLSGNEISGTSPSTANTNFADFGNVNNLSSGSLSTNKTTAGTFLDPFGAAPNSNFQQSDNNNDLFANAPKPTMYSGSESDKTVGILTSDIFGTPNPSSYSDFAKNYETRQNEFGDDPWASSNGSKDSSNTTTPAVPWSASADGDTLKQTNWANNLFASSMVPASKSTNPFL